MAVSIRDRGKKGVWLIIRVPGRKPRERYCGMREAGLKIAQDRKEKLDQAESDEQLWHQEAGPLPIDALVRSWRDTHSGTQSWRWQQTCEARVERLAKWFGPRDLRQLTESDLRAFASAQLQGKPPLKGWTVAGHLSILRRVYTIAIDEGLFQPRRRLPFSQVMRDARKRGEGEVPTRDAWTPQEVQALLALAQPHAQLGPLLAFLLGTGCRRGEALGLRWEDIDGARARVHFRRVPTGEGDGKTKAPKTGGRMTPLTPSVLALLERLRGARLPTDWVFPGPTGGAWTEAYLHRHWARLRKRAIARKVRPLPLHCTRHTAITSWLAAGVPTKRVSEWVGASVVTLERHYAHVLPMESEVPDLLAGTTHAIVGDPRVGKAASRRSGKRISRRRSAAWADRE